MSRANRSVGIVGGSIAGSAAAVMLHRAGWDVSVFERAGEALQERGAGINIYASEFQRFVDSGLLDANIPTCPVRAYRFRWTDQHEAGRLVGTFPADNHALHWGDLYWNLRKRVPAACYHGGRDVAQLRQDEHAAVLMFAGGGEQKFDLVVAADGYRSIGRRALFPDLKVNYAGYVAWRGLLDESVPACSDLLDDAVVGIGSSTTHSAFYFVPGTQGKQPGQRLINWLVYHRVAAVDLPNLFGRSAGGGDAHSLPPGQIPDCQLAQLHGLAHRAMPSYFSNLCTLSEDTFLQAIFETAVPDYAQGRICLLGDAGALASPMSTAGAMKAINDALALGLALSTDGDIDMQLHAWSRDRSLKDNYLYRLGRHRGRHVVMKDKDWGAMDKAAFGRWFNEANTLNEG